MSGKNYGDIRHLAMGDHSHESVANLLLQANANSANLQSVLRAGHDRILHLAQTAGSTDTTEIETLRQQLHDANVRLNEAAGNAIELNGKLIESEKKWLAEKERADNLQGQVTALNGELQHIKDNYDLSDLDAEGDAEGEEKIEDRENEADFGEREAYMPSRAEIKEIALAQGFRIPQGAQDLRDYVYTTAEEVVKLAHSRS